MQNEYQSRGATVLVTRSFGQKKLFDLMNKEIFTYATKNKLTKDETVDTIKIVDGLSAEDT